MYAVTSAVARAPIAVAKKTNAAVAKRAAAVKPVAAVKGANEKVRNRLFLFFLFEVRTGRDARSAREERGSWMRDARCDASIGRRRERGSPPVRVEWVNFVSLRSVVTGRVRTSRRPSYGSARRSSDRSIGASSGRNRMTRVSIRRITNRRLGRDTPKTRVLGRMDGWISRTSRSGRRPTEACARIHPSSSSRRLNRCNRFPCGVKPSFVDRVFVERARSRDATTTGRWGLRGWMGWIAQRGWLACTARYGFWFGFETRPGVPA